ncbi:MULTISPECIES: sugar ABC transporter substrate-binding protein [Bacillus]|uniref:sugar ABC transporter substrate-binding protein n=1 Tax=Bacillus TaxID=1386 RepID=UPI000C759569|nr:MULTISPECIES: sugar ABC transporter substrate-binding protein [Bacillus]PLR87762.1 rhizopine-binding protein [Bacillus sp. V33-4]RSK55207.1 sugar ABC transporter substrate-binding protein [Bacillus canaveralius]
MKLSKKEVTTFYLILVFILAACSGGEQTTSKVEGKSGGAGDKKVIGISLQNFSDEFRTYMIDAMKEEEKNHPDFKFMYSDAQNDSAKQMNQIENFIAQKVDAIIFTPVDTVAAVDILARVNEAGIPIIVSNQTFDGVEDATAYVGSESIESGLLQMEKVAKLLDGKGNIAIMHGQMGHEAEIMRTDGNKEIIAKNPGMKVVLEDTAEWNREKGLTLMENWLHSGKKIDAVVANNDEMAIGAIMALEADGKLDEVIVAGVDATPAALEFMQSDKLEVTVFQDAIGQGVGSIQTAVKAANGEPVEDVIVPYKLVTPDNVEEYAEIYK